MKVTVTGHARRLADGWESDLVIETSHRWLRGGLFYGPPPGSHMGFWRTNWAELHGWNYRVEVHRPGAGRWRCLTALLHTKKGPGGHYPTHRCRPLRVG